MPSAFHSAQELKTQGYDCLIAPMLTITPISFTPPNSSSYKTLIFTSQHAPALFASKLDDNSPFFIKPALCVGKTTQAAAKAAGFHHAINAGANVQELATYAKNNPSEERREGRHLYLSARQPAAPLKEWLEQGNIQTDQIDIYEALPAQDLPSFVISAIENGDVSAALFTSKRTADTFAKLILKNGLDSHLKTINALSISPSVLDCLSAFQWKNSLSANMPTMDALTKLLRKTCPVKPQKPKDTKITAMDNEKKYVASLDNAEDIIERFGGIRPMATKIGAAVTTVQGWKKRGTIPHHRIDTIIEAALNNDIDLSNLIDMSGHQEQIATAAAAIEATAAAVEDESNAQELAAMPASPSPVQEAPVQQDLPQASPKPEPTAPQATPKPQSQPAAHQAPPAEPTQPTQPETKKRPYDDTRVFTSSLHDDIIYSITQAERRAVTKSTQTALLLAATSTIIALGLIFGLQSGSKNEAQRMAELKVMQEEMKALKEDVDAIKRDPGFLDQLSSSINKDSVETLTNSASQAIKRTTQSAKKFADDISGGNTEEVLKQIAELEKQLGGLQDMTRLSSITQRFDAFVATTGGQKLLEESTADLSDAVKNVKGSSDEAFTTAIEKARGSSAALNQSLENVPTTDLKAAALLLTMTQLRGALNRNQEPFKEDLELLQSLIDDDNTELKAAIKDLSPHAKDGILTSQGLSNELKSLTGEIVVASLKGEDLNIKDRAAARLKSALLKKEKDGNVSSGSSAQTTLNDANKRLQNGDIEGAIAQVKMLDGNAAKAAAPWLKKAQASLTAQDLKSTLSGVLGKQINSFSAYNSAPYARQNRQLTPLYVKP